MSMNIEINWILYFGISIVFALAVIATNTENSPVDGIKATAFYFILFMTVPALILGSPYILAGALRFFTEFPF